MTPDERKGIVAPLPANYRTNDFDLANVTPEQVRQILRNVRTGKLEDQDRLFRMMVDTWPRLSKALNEIASAVSKLVMEIKPAMRPGEDEPTPQSQRITDVVKRALESYAPHPQAWELDLQGMIKSLIDAYAKGISVLEIVWQSANGVVSPRCYCPIPAKYLAYPNTSNAIDRLMIAPNGVNSSNLEDFPPDKFIIGTWQKGGMHPIHAANLRPLTKYWLASVYGLGWSMQFAQNYGTPWRHVETDGSDEAMTKAEQLLENIGANGWAVTGKDVKLNIMNGVSGDAANLPQAYLQEVADRACDILLLGQTLTTDNTGTGSRALGDVHSGIRREYIEGVASWVASIITSQLIPSIVRLNFGNVPSEDLPYCEIIVPEPKDQKVNAERVKIVKEIGIPVTKKWMYEALEIPAPQEGEELFDDMPDMPEPPNGPIDPNQALPDDDEEYDEEVEEIDLTPTDEMAQNAMDALDAKRNKGEKERGMGTAYVMRARDIADKVKLNMDTVKAMALFFQQVEASNQEGWKEKGKRWQEYNAMGGDAGREWANNIIQAAAPDLKPSEAMAEEAKRGLEWRRVFGRGGTEVGVARARDISNRANLSPDTIGRMVSYFARHEVDKKAEGFSPGEVGYPSAGRIAWALWGGDAGQSWANAKQRQLKK
jgi:phage gp29-like protein